MEENVRNTHKSIKLPEAVAKKFRISGENARRRCHWHRHINIDLNTISVEKAEKLVQEGFPYLVAKEAGAVSPSLEGQAEGQKGGKKS